VSATDPTITGGSSDPTLGTDAAATGTSSTPSRSPSDFRYTLRPGTGPATATPTHGAQGSGLGATEKAIADWDVVPFQVINGTLDVGVVAWHVNTAGIDHVDIRVDGGPWTSVSQATTNPDSGVVEYYAQLRADQFTSAKTVQLQAIAYPVVGAPSVLQSYNMYVDPANTLASHKAYVKTTGSDSTGVVNDPTHPFLTIAKAATSIQSAFGRADGGTILVSPGTYDGGTGGADTSFAYLTVEADPSTVTSRGQVVIDGFTGQPTHQIHFDGVTMTVGVPNISASDPRFLWIDQCNLDHGDPLSDATGFTGWTDARSGGTPGQPWTSGDGMVQTASATDSTITNSANGWLNGLLIRNCTITKLGSDAISNTQTSINCTISSLGVPNSGMHPDVGQWNNHKTDVILYGITGTSLDMSQGISPEDNGAVNWAIVNINLQSNGFGNMLGLGSSLTNFYVKNAVLNAPATVRAASGWTGADVVFEHVVDGSGNPVGGVPSGVVVR
jgi:hypothetical protein